MAEYLIQGSELAQLCGPFLPVAALPETRSREARGSPRGWTRLAFGA